jgi:hypothetical protein
MDNKIITPRIRLGESVSDKVRRSVGISVRSSVYGSVRVSVHGPIYDSVWRLLVVPVSNSTNFRL